MSKAGKPSGELRHSVERFRTCLCPDSSTCEESCLKNLKLASSESRKRLVREGGGEDKELSTYFSLGSALFLMIFKLWEPINLF